MPDEVVAVTRTYELILWAVPQVNKLPRDHCFTLGDRLVAFHVPSPIVNQLAARLVSEL